MTLDDIMAHYESIGEHAVVVLFASTGNAAIPVCWCHTAAEAVETRRRLLAAVAEDGKRPLIWCIPVSEVPRLP